MDRWMMAPGWTVGGRFEVESLVRQEGRPEGMSQVFRARELATGQPVALKVVDLGNHPREEERFLRQVEGLAGLEHEGIAGYVGHGQVAHGQRRFYVATRWLVGEDLGRRLRRQPLTVAESLTLVRAVAEALAVGHDRGVVHGALKPSKLLLRANAVERAAVLHFGIAAGDLAVQTFDRTGAIVAALRYLAPEQARGAEPVDARADVHALGCVLFECLTGRALFVGQHPPLVLARILHEEVPRLRQLRPELPEALERLLVRMLAKEPAARLRDGRAVVEALAEVSVSPELGQELPGPPWSGAMQGGLAAGRPWVCTILVLPCPRQVEPRAEPNAAEAADEGGDRVEEVKRLLRQHGAQVEKLAGGGVRATLPEAWGMAADQAVHAARVALVLRQTLGAWSIAVTTAKGSAAGAQGMAEAVQQAVELLPADAEGEGPRPVWLDELTAALLETRFHVRRAPGGLGGPGGPGGETVGWVLEGERQGSEEVRTLLGRPTPCVGRERELKLLEIQLRACHEESVARGLVVIAPAGVGKSRLGQELLRQVRERGEGAEILRGVGDPLRVGVAYGLLGQALRQWCGLGVWPGPGSQREPEPRPEPRSEEARRQEFVRRVGRFVTEGERGQQLEFLAEMCGVALHRGPGGSARETGEASAESPQLRAARQDPRLMKDGVTAAWVGFLRALCAAHPVLLVLEDLHWSDAATVRLVGVTLQALAEERLMVLGLGRPEVKELFPQLWDKYALQELRLPVLSRRASERLVREMLGEKALPETVGRIVEQAGGHALFLEELIRGAAEGTGQQLPETVQAMLQARLVRLDPEARRVLAVASLMGETFWRGAVVKLLGAGEDVHAQDEVDHWLRVLEDSEVIVLQGAQETRRFAGEVQYAFRHVLVRDAAYELLFASDEERRRGHRLVARCLAEMGEKDLVVLAEHERLGGELGKAAASFARAAVQAMEASDPGGALRCVERGVACGATEEVLGTLRAVEAQAALWSSRFAAALEAGTAALALLGPGSAAWYRASGPVLSLSGTLGREALFEQLRVFAEPRPQPGAESAFVEPALLALHQISLLGIGSLARSLLGRMQEVCEGLGAREVRARGLMQLARSWYHLLMEGDPWPSRQAALEALACLETAGDRRYHALAQGHLGLTQALVGDREGALASLRAALATLEALKEVTMLRMAEAHLAVVLTEVGAPRDEAEALALAERVLDGQPVPSFWTVLGHGVRAQVLAGRGELAEAEAAARQAAAAAAAAPAGTALASSLLSRILRSRGQLDEARQVAEEALKWLATQGGAGFMDVKLRLAAAEACARTGAPEAAQKALRLAERQILRRAAQIPEEAARRRFVEAVRDHERVRALGAGGPPSTAR